MGFLVSDVIVDMSGAGDHVLVGAQGDKAIKVFRIALTVRGGDVVFRFKSGSSILLGKYYIAEGVALTFGMERRRWFETAMGEPLVLHIDGDVDVAGTLSVWVG